MQKHFTPVQVVYLLAHLLLFAVGFGLTYRQGAGQVEIAVGTSLIAGGITGWVIWVYVARSQITRDRLDLLDRFGLIGAFPVRAAAIRQEYESRIRGAEEGIDVIGFGLRALREDYRGSFADWGNKLRVRVLLLDPEFPSPERSYATQRDMEERQSPNITRQEIRQFVVDTAPLIRRGLDSRGNGFEVRLYRCLPTVNIFRVDREMFWGPYLVNRASRNTPTFLVRQGVVFDSLAAHFNQIWEDPQLVRDVPPDWLHGSGR